MTEGEPILGTMFEERVGWPVTVFLLSKQFHYTGKILYENEHVIEILDEKTQEIMSFGKLGVQVVYRKKRSHVQNIESEVKDVS